MVLALDAGKIRDEINDLLGRNGAETCARRSAVRQGRGEFRTSFCGPPA